jgi:hypothetical protein
MTEHEEVVATFLAEDSTYEVFAASFIVDARHLATAAMVLRERFVTTVPRLPAEERARISTRDVRNCLRSTMQYVAQLDDLVAALGARDPAVPPSWTPERLEGTHAAE